MVNASGTPLTGTPQNATTDGIDPIIGGPTATFDQLLPEDPTFTNTSFLALAQPASLGSSNPTSTDLLASSFPAAGLDSSPTTPWLVATQPLL
jgi:hypothetical protein